MRLVRVDVEEAEQRPQPGAGALEAHELVEARR